MEEDTITMALRDALHNTGTLLKVAKDPSTPPESLIQMTIVLTALRRSRSGAASSYLRSEVEVHADIAFIDVILSELAARKDAPPLVYEMLSSISNSQELMRALSDNETAPRLIRKSSRRAAGYLQMLRDIREERSRSYDAWRTVYDMTPKHVRRLLSLY